MSKIKLTGILQMAVNDKTKELIRGLRDQLPKEAHLLKEEDLHITLLKLSKQDRAKVQMAFVADQAGIAGVSETRLEEFDVKALPKVHRIDRPARGEAGKVTPPRSSWIVLVDDGLLLNGIINDLASETGVVLSDYERNRPYHISIANLTGSPFDSVGDVMWDDLGGFTPHGRAAAVTDLSSEDVKILQGVHDALEPMVSVDVEESSTLFPGIATPPGHQAVTINLPTRMVEKIRDTIREWEQWNEHDEPIGLSSAIMKLINMGLRYAKDELEHQHRRGESDDDDIPF